MNITVSVLSSQAAAKIKAIEAQLKGLNGTMAAGAAASAGFIGSRQIASLTKFGNQLQWTGRQLQYNFTLPIALAGAAAMKFALDNQAAMTRVSKVYGDASMDASVLKNELHALEGAFEALSNQYGVQQSQVIAIAADWAAAGASGLALARGVEQTLRVMVLGEMEAADATQALISIQAQYNLSSAQLVDTIAKLNVVENQTAISMQGLIQGFQRSAGVARAAGVDVDHLAAMLASLVPSAGSAAQAGNALKTILSRVMSPTKKAADLMKEMGINVDSVGWSSLNGSQRLEVLAQKFHGLADSQKTAVATTIASQYQLNKFEILMDQIFKASDKATKAQSRYSQALDATANRSIYLKKAETELDQVLRSNPQKLKQIWVILQNAMADIIIPMIPVLLMAANALRRMVEAFRGLPPEVQKAITFLLLFLALFGPMLRYIGSTMTLIGELGWFFGGLAAQAFGAIKVLLTFALFPFNLVATGIGAMAGGLVKFGASILAGGRALFAFIATRPLFIAMMTGIMASLQATGAALLGIWTQTLLRIRLITGPLLLAVQSAFLLWTAGLARIMVVARTAVIAGWGSMVAASKFVGPALIAVTTTLWAGIVSVTKIGITAVLVRTRLMWTAMIALFANWRVILLNLWGKMWATMVLLSKGGIAAIGRGLLAAASVLVGPIGLAIAAVLAVLYLFRDQIAQLVRNIIDFFRNMPPGIASAFKPVVNIFHTAVGFVVKAFNALPKGVRDAMIAVVNVVASAARQVYELFSYINPFAHHSPSLVENVTEGMAIVKQQIASITDVSGSIKQAYRELQAFGNATKSLLQGMDKASRAEDRSNLGKVAPGALDEFDKLVKRVMSLTTQLNRLKSAVDAQQASVDAWKNKLDAANAALDAQNKKLDSLQKTLDTANKHLDAAQDALQNYANTPIKGMKAMEDQIFANDQAQKKLRLEMMKMEDAGGSIDDLNGKMQALQGQMELLSGERTSLRDAGAGSEILKTYDDQIKKVEEQTKGVSGQISEYNKLSNELDKLARQGEELDLEKSLKFDELTKQINDAANATKEMSFEQIIAGIKTSNQQIAQYTNEVNKANAAVENQQKVVDAATAARDRISAQYDAEQAKLDTLKDAYDKVNQTIQDINSSLQEMTGAANDAIQKAKAAADAAAKAGQGGLGPAGDFPDVAGSGSLGREGGLGDQSALIDQFTKDLATKTGDLLGGFDLFGPVKKKFNELKGWFSKNVGPVFGAIGDGVMQVFSGIDWGAPFKNMDFSWAHSFWDTIKDIFNTGFGWIKDAVKLFAPDFKKGWDAVVQFGKDLWNEVGPEIAKFKDLLKPLADLFSELWTVLKPIAAIVGIVLVGAFKILTSVLANILGPALDIVVAIIKGVIEVLRGVIEFVVGVFTGNWKLAWQGIKDIFKGIWDAIWGILKGLGGVLWGIVKGIVEGIVDFFKWLYEVLVGHSIIPDMVKAIISWIASLPQKAWDALKDLGNKIVDVAKKAWKMFQDAISDAWKGISSWFSGRAQAAWDAMKDLGSKLKQKAKDALNDFQLGAKLIWNDIQNWFGSWKDRISDKISNIAGSLKSIATNAVNKFKDGASSAWNSVVSFFGGWYSKIKNAIGSVSLWDIGKSIMNSLLDGLKNAWETVKGWLGNVGGWIKDIKGPIEKDRKLLIPEGGAIMESLGNGLKAQWPSLKRYLQTVAPNIQDAIASTVATALPIGIKRADAAQSGTLLAAPQTRLATAGVGANQTGTTSEYGTRYEINFYGDLEFPNVTDGGSAEEFLLNLEAMIRG